MSYLPGKLGTIGKTINYVAGHVDSMTGMLPNGGKGKEEHYTGRGTTSNNFGYTVDRISRNMGGGCNNQSVGGNVNQTVPQQLHDFISNMNV
jgi:hypothetical protein